MTVQENDPGITARRDAVEQNVAGSDELLSRLELISAQALEQHAAGYDQLADELLAQLQQSDRELA